MWITDTSALSLFSGNSQIAMSDRVQCQSVAAVSGFGPVLGVTSRHVTGQPDTWGHSVSGGSDSVSQKKYPKTKSIQVQVLYFFHHRP